MLKFKSVVLFASLLTMPQSANAAKPPQVYSPSTPWNLDYAADSCVLRRRFGGEKHAILLEMRQFQPGDAIQLTVASEFVKPREAAALKTRFLPDEKPRAIDFPLILEFPGKLIAARWGDSLYSDEKADSTVEELAGQPWKQRDEATYKAREGAISGLEIGGVFSPPIIFQTGEMHRPMTGMRKCLDELVTHWGIDAAAQKSLTRRARPADRMAWTRLIQAKYPSAMLNAGRSGRVLVRMIVGADGKPTSCNVQSIVEDVSFGQTACTGMMKVARFDPALDAAGKPIASYFHTNIIYKAN